LWRDSFICVTWLIQTPCVCAMTHSYVCHDSFICVPWLIHVCDMTPSDSLCVCHDTFISNDVYIHILIYTCDITSLTPTASPSIRVMSHVWTNHVIYGVIFAYSWVMSPISLSAHPPHRPRSGCVPWLIHMCDMTYPCVSHAIILL